MIGIFDSGYGGMTVLKPILERLPQYDYIYLGDSARTPYGNHNEENIKKFSEEAVNYLWSRGVNLIIFACNTASAVALRYIQQKYPDKKVLGVLIPVAEKAAEVSKAGRVGVVGTRATINSGVYTKEIHKLNPEVQVYGKACPLLVPFIEEDWHDKPEAISILKKYLRPLKSYNIDTLILGCTHYPLMTSHFKRIMGKRVNVLESGIIAAESLKDYLTRHPEIDSKLTKQKLSPAGPATAVVTKPQRIFLTTDDPTRFKTFVEKHFGMKIRTPERVELP